MTPPVKSLRGLIPAAIAFVVITGGLIIGINALGLERIRDLIASAGPFAPILYIAVKAVTYVVAPLSSGPIQLFSGILFGLIPGMLYTLVGEVLGGSLNFLLARRFGRPVVKRIVGAENLPRVDAFVDQIVDWKTLLYARLFLFSLYDFISYAVGFSHLRYHTYLIISIFAGVIPTFIAALLGTSLTEERSGLLLVYGLVGLASVVPLLFQKRIRGWLKLEKPTEPVEKRLP